MSNYIRYATDISLPKSIEVKRENIQNEIQRITGMNVKITLNQTQRYLAAILKQPKIKFDLNLWNKTNK